MALNRIMTMQYNEMTNQEKVSVLSYQDEDERINYFVCNGYRPVHGQWKRRWGNVTRRFTKDHSMLEVLDKHGRVIRRAYMIWDGS